MWNTNIPKEEAERCLLCPEGPCTAACPHGLYPAGLLRSVRFQNIAGAAGRLPAEDLCAGCPAPCEGACLRPDGPVRIRRLCTALHKEKEGMEALGGDSVDLSSTFCGVRLENPFLLSSSVVAQLVTKRQMVWPSSASPQWVKITSRDSRSTSSLAIMMNCWLVGESIQNLYPFSSNILRIFMAMSMACCEMLK